MISIYENELLAKNNRPFGTNTIELRMMLCMAVRDFHFDRTQKKGIEFMPYVTDYINTLIKPRDPKVFGEILKLELINAQKLSFITPTGELTPRGILFIELNTKGSYMYVPSRNFDIMFHNFLSSMQYGNENYYYSPEIPNFIEEEKVESELPLVNEETGEKEDIRIPAEQFAAFLEQFAKKEGIKPSTTKKKRRVRKS